MDDQSKRFIVGIYPRVIVPTELVKRGPAAAFRKSLEKNWESGTMVLRTLSGIITGKIKPKALSGPIGIVQMIAGSLRQALPPVPGIPCFIARLNGSSGYPTEGSRRYTAIRHTSGAPWGRD